MLHFLVDGLFYYFSNHFCRYITKFLSFAHYFRPLPKKLYNTDMLTREKLPFSFITRFRLFTNFYSFYYDMRWCLGSCFFKITKDIFDFNPKGEITNNLIVGPLNGDIFLLTNLKTP